MDQVEPIFFISIFFSSFSFFFRVIVACFLFVEKKENLSV